MFRWAPYAMVRVTLCLVAGVLIGINGYTAPSPIVATAIGLVLALFILGFLLKNKPLAGFSGLSVVVIFGYLLVLERTPRLREDHLANITEEVLAYEVVVSGYPEERANSIRTKGDILSVLTSSGWQQSPGALLIYTPKRDSVQYNYGDLLFVRGMPKQIPPPSNPGAFDFSNYMAYKGIYFQDFTSRDRVRLIRNEPQNLFLSHAIQVRLWAERQITAVVAGHREQATAAALVLGVTDGLDSELLQAYASTGALHVLAVSGLHVSIIYWIILIVLKPLDRTRPLKWLLAFISLFMLWSYAFVSGWSPSVLRAVTMFSFVAISRPWRQSTNIFNTLASSMFCLLLYDPYFIMSVGFQLSYLAVFGIVFLQPKLYAIWEPRNRILDEIWKVSSVSLAAQIATLPIGLYYFHQFPTYFLAANLVVIPISFVVLVVGLAIAVFAFFDPLTNLLGGILTWTIRLMNGTVILFEQLPFSVIDNIYITQLQCVLIAALIACVVLLFIYKNFAWLIGGLIMASLFSYTQWLGQLETGQRSLVRIYNIKEASAIDHISPGRSTILADSLSVNGNAIRNNISPSWLFDGVRRSSWLSASNLHSGEGFRFWVWQGTSFIQVIGKEHTLPKGQVQFVIISNNAVTSLRELAGVKCEKIIVDSSNSIYFAERLRKEAETLGLSLWSVIHDGAFEYKHVPR